MFKETVKIRRMLRISLALAFFTCLFSVPGRTSSQDKQIPTLTVSVNLVKVPISVIDNQGLLVTDLRKENFRVWEDQALQEIRSFGLERNPVSVVLVLDTSNTGKSELKKIKEAAEAFVDTLSEEDRVALITFDDEVKRVTIDVATDPNAEQKRIMDLRKQFLSD